MMRWITLVLGICTSFCISLWSQDLPLDRSSPRNTVYQFLYYTEEAHYAPEKAGLCFRTSPEVNPALVAEKFRQILNARGIEIPLHKLPDTRDYWDTLHLAQRVELPISIHGLFLTKSDSLWLFDETTTAKIPALFRETFPFGTDWLMALLPGMAEKEWLGLKAWQILGILVIVLLFLALHVLSTKLIEWLTQRLIHSPRVSTAQRKATHKMSIPLSWYVQLHVVQLLVPSLQLPMPLAHVIMLGLDMLAPVVLTFTLWRGVDLAMVFAAEKAEKTETTLDDQLVPLLRKILKVLTLGFGLVLVLRALNFNIAALIAGASLGGLALALAAQDTIKNMFGSLMIFLDKPFHIGHWILADGVDGVVEEVGFRSTRVRTFQNSVVYVPNGKISDMVVNNMGMRQYRRYQAMLGIEYGTPADRIEAFVKALRDLANEYPAAVQGQSQVHLFSFSASSLDIRFQVFLDVPNFDAELACREALMFSILRLAEQCQVGFAFPTQTLHVASLPTNGNANVR